MGEVLCVATWDEKTHLKWLKEREDRYLISIAEVSCEHPRLYAVGHNMIAFQQAAKELTFLPFRYADLGDLLLQKMCALQLEMSCRAADFADQGVRLLTNYKHNLHTPSFRAASCYGHFSNTTAVICGAGPSLKEAILSLQAHRDKLLIIGCGAGVEALLAAGVRPHLALHVDPDPVHVFSKTEVPLFFQLRTSHEVVAKYSGPKFLMAGAGTFPLETWIEERLDLEDPVDGGWSAVTRGAVLARAFGCSRVHFVGVDFSGPYVKGAGIKQQEPRSDWILAAQWLAEYRQATLSVAWMRGLEHIAYGPVPDMPAADRLQGAAVWQEVARQFTTVQELANSFLTRLQTVFPRLPGTDPVCGNIIEQINAHFITQKVLDPIWNYWEKVLQRQPENHADALQLHRVLLLKSLADRF